MKNHIFNFKKTYLALILSFVFTSIIFISILSSDIFTVLQELKILISILMPGVLAMLAIYLSGLAILIGTLRIELVREFGDKVKQNLNNILHTFYYASKVAGVLFTLLLLTYLLLGISFYINDQVLIFITIIYSFMLIYILFFLIQFTIYLINIILRIYKLHFI